MKHTFDASDKPLGRLATEIAFILQDKNTPQYEPRKAGENVVVVKNIEKLKVTGSKADQKIYYRHSGKPGNLRSETYSQVFQKYPERILISAVRGMLPRNKLLKDRLKRLVIEK